MGIGLRRPHFQDLLEGAPDVDWFEFVPENFVGRGGIYRRALEHCARAHDLVAHGVSLSLGGPDPLPLAYLERLGELLERTGVAVYSDHICFAQVGREGFYDLLPLPWTLEAAEHVGARAAEVGRRLGRPLVLEPISTYAIMPGSEVDEATFVRAVLERADAHLLLDLNNLYVNARNHGWDPLETLEAMPLDRVAYVHLAGHSQDCTRLLDSHDAPVDEGVWSLFAHLVRRLGPVPTLIEWDAKIPSLDVVMGEVAKARAVLDANTRRREGAKS